MMGLYGFTSELVSTDSGHDLRSEEKGNGVGELESVSDSSSPSRYENGPLENRYRGIYDSEHWVKLRNGVRRLCRHPVFQLSKPTKKRASLGVVCTSVHSFPIKA